MMHIKKTANSLFIILGLIPFLSYAQNAPEGSKEWINQSNNYTKVLIDLDKKYSPEFGSSQGLAYYDTLISVPTLANVFAERKERLKAVAMLKEAKQKETNNAVKQ